MKNYFYFKDYSNEYIHFGITSFFFYPNNDWDTQITYPYRNLLTLNKILEKASQITEDDLKGYSDDIQKVTDKFVAEIDKVTKEKQEELMSV